MGTVLAFGSFDILHPGHIKYLESASKLGERLVVIISRDDSIRLIKHREPFLDEKARLKIVGSLKMVDKAVLGNKLKKHNGIYEIFKKYKPDVIALGYDQNANVPAMRKWLIKNKIKARIVRLSVKINTHDYKSSKIIARIRKNKN